MPDEDRPREANPALDATVSATIVPYNRIVSDPQKRDAAPDASDSALLSLLLRLKATDDPAEIRRLSAQLEQIVFAKRDEEVDVDPKTSAGIDQGIRDADEGRTVPLEEVRKMIPQWIEKFKSR